MSIEQRGCPFLWNNTRNAGSKRLIAKMYRAKSKNGNDSVVHYVKDPKTGKLMDFKFKKLT
jgi:hypothetical protein